MEKTFDQMNATERTKFLGFRSYSEKEKKLRQKEFIKKGSELTVMFLKAILAKENVVISRDMSDQEKDAMYKDVINETYDFAFNNGYTTYDLESVTRNLQDLAVMTERMANFANGEHAKLSFALTGENKFEFAPMKTMANITKTALEVFPREEIVEDDEITEPAQEDIAKEETNPQVTE